MNTDGSEAGLPGPTSCGGVLRTYMGFVRDCFASPPSILHAFDVELTELIKTLEQAQSNHRFPLWIEADSVYLVELLRNRSRDIVISLFNNTIS